MAPTFGKAGPPIVQVSIDSLETAERIRVAGLWGSSPVLAALADGALLAVAEQEMAPTGKGLSLVASRSSDDGESWAEPVVVAGSREYDCRSPSIGVAADGSVVVAYHACGRHETDGQTLHDRRTPEARHTGIVRSLDHGRTWAEPMVWTDATPWDAMTPCGGMLTLADGTLVMPICSGGSYLVRSRDHGVSWGELTLAAHETNRTSLCLLPDGQWLAAGLTQQNPEERVVVIRRSVDHGWTWTAPREFGENGSLAATLLPLRNGSVLYFFGSETEPFGLCARLSRDSGGTWSKTVLVLCDARIPEEPGCPSAVSHHGWVIAAFGSERDATSAKDNGAGGVWELLRVREDELISAF